MRLRITTRLFLAVFATAALVVAAMAVAAQWSMNRGFLGYLNEQALERMDAALPRVRAAYADHGSWEFLRGRPDRWFELLRPAWEPPGPGGPPAAGTVGFRVGRPRPALPVSELTGANLRWSLADAQRRWVAGSPLPRGGIERPVTIGSEAVGYFVLTPFESVAAAGAQRFERSQLHASLAVAGAALALAALAAWWLARSLLRPIRSLAAATRRLAAGDYGTRVEVASRDEVGALAEDFNHLAGALQQNADIRRSFFADVSHELRTPLAILRAEIEAIDDGVRPFTHAAVKSLRVEAQALSQLVGDLHELSLAGSGSLSYRMEFVDVAQLLREAELAFRHRATRHGLALELRLDATQLAVRADPGRLRQVLHNLLENAMRYTDPGGVVQVGAVLQGGQVGIEVRDSAPGVAPAELPLLFARFHRVAGKARPDRPGSGLGLAICRAVVEAHRGGIEAGPSPLGGLAVRIVLPEWRE